MHVLNILLLNTYFSNPQPFLKILQPISEIQLETNNIIWKYRLNTKAKKKKKTTSWKRNSIKEINNFENPIMSVQSVHELYKCSLSQPKCTRKQKHPDLANHQLNNKGVANPQTSPFMDVLYKESLQPWLRFQNLI